MKKLKRFLPFIFFMLVLVVLAIIFWSAQPPHTFKPTR
jgi:hypothetical protein